MRNIGLAFFLLVSLSSLGQSSIQYLVEPFNLDHHEVKISITFSEINGETLEIRMPNASPGRYATHNFAKNLYGEKAYDTEGNEVAIERLNPSSWGVSVPENGSVSFEYILFANHADGTYAGFDAQRLHINMPATFAYGVGLDDREITLNIDLSAYPEWSIASQLQKKGNNTLTAPNYYYFYDSPTVAGKMRITSWQVDNQTINIAMMHECSDADFEKYVSWVKGIVEQEKAVYGELPKFDFGQYTFICAYSPYVFGDAMEHRNSTICTSQGNLANHAHYMIGSLAHEFFHAWNIERLRPATLEPFDFDHANMSGELWFGEGFTNYYDELSQCRAGVFSRDKYLNTAASVLNRVQNSPARNYRTPIQMSYNAPYVDAATAVDETNYVNNFISYYTYGEMLGLALDLSIRANFKNLSLDDFMQYMWQNFGKPETPYTISDLQAGLAKVTSDKAFADTFFEKYIYDSQIPDFASLYENVGINLSLENPDAVNMGNIEISKTGYISTPVLQGTDLYATGLDKGDRIISIAGTTITDNISFTTCIGSLVVGKAYNIQFEKMGELREATFTTTQDPTVKLEYDEAAKKKQLKNREAWLGAK